MLFYGLSPPPDLERPSIADVEWDILGATGGIDTNRAVRR